MDRVLHYQWRAAEILSFVFIISSFAVLLSLLIGWLVMGVVRVCSWALRESRRLEAFDDRLKDILPRLYTLFVAMFGAGFAVGALTLVFPWALVAVGLFAAVTKLMFRVVPDREPIINSEGSSREE